MPSNFDFLQPHWAALHEDARQTEQNVFAAPRTCAFYAAAPADRTAEQMQQLQEQLTAQDDALAASEAARQGTQEEIERLRREIAELRAANEQALPAVNYGEAATRDLFVDVLLREADWDPHGADVCEYPVTGMPNETGEGYVDNVLWGKDRLPLAVVEVKRTKVSPQNGQQQAKLYADCLERMTGQRPIIFYSNGFETWMWDDTNYPPRQVQGFYKQDELQLLINRRTSRQAIAIAPINQEIIDRPYHYEAIRRMMETYGLDWQRAALQVMATGTGRPAWPSPRWTC